MIMSFAPISNVCISLDFAVFDGPVTLRYSEYTKALYTQAITSSQRYNIYLVPGYPEKTVIRPVQGEMFPVAYMFLYDISCNARLV